MSSESNNNNSNEVKDYSGIDKKIFVVIPAYNTGAILLSVVRKTLQYAHHIVVINDGSDAENEHVFADLKEFPDVKLISHERNLGKGFALITGIKYCLGEMSDHDYLVTLDGDGQHDPENIQDFNALVARKGHVDFILGERRDDKQMPLKSRFGNTIARVLFKIQFGGKIHDTQSGFRMLSRGFCEKFIQSISPGRYETELDMLILALKNLKHVETVPISTIYFENNKRTSFQPFPDSYRVMRLFVK